MKIIEEVYKCAVCGKENKYKHILSNYTSGFMDFDMRPTGSMMEVGEEIMECPNCHYANYNISTTIEKRFTNDLELWNNSSDFQDIIKNYSGTLRKILLVANQYENNMDYKNAYQTFIKASWVCDDEKSDEFRTKACKIFFTKVFSGYRDDILQITDLLRMLKDFEMADSLLEVAKNITDDTDNEMLKIIGAEQNLIQQKDSSRHNLSEVFNDVKNEQN